MEYLKSKKVLKEFNETHNYSLGVYLLEDYIVKKIVKNNIMGMYMLNNEVSGLIKLIGHKHFPRLFGYDRNSIYMTYCGENTFGYRA